MEHPSDVDKIPFITSGRNIGTYFNINLNDNDDDDDDDDDGEVFIVSTYLYREAKLNQTDQECSHLPDIMLLHLLRVDVLGPTRY